MNTVDLKLKITYARKRLFALCLRGWCEFLCTAYVTVCLLVICSNIYVLFVFLFILFLFVYLFYSRSLAFSLLFSFSLVLSLSLSVTLFLIYLYFFFHFSMAQIVTIFSADFPPIIPEMSERKLYDYPIINGFPMFEIVVHFVVCVIFY